MAANNARFNVEFTVSGDGTVKAKVGDLSKEVEKAGAAAHAAGDKWEDFGRRAGIAMGTLAGLAVTGMGLVIRNTIQAEHELAQLDAVLKSTGNAAGYSRDQLVDMANKMDNSSIFSGGEIIKAQTRLLSYSNIVGETFPRALQAAMDQAARLGIGLEQSSEIIGRALGEPTKAMGALAQQGFSFTEEQKALVKQLDETGHAAEAQAIILGMLEESYKDADRAARETFMGALKELGQVLQNLTTGEDGSLDSASQAVNELINLLSDQRTKDAFSGMITGAFDLAGALGTMAVAASEAFTEAQRALTLQVGGTRQLADIKQIRYELGELQKEQTARDSGDRSWLGETWRQTQNFTSAGALFPVSGMTDKELRNRIAELQRMEQDSLDIFGDPRWRGVRATVTHESAASGKPPTPPPKSPNGRAAVAAKAEEWGFLEDLEIHAKAAAESLAEYEQRAVDAHNASLVLDESVQAMLADLEFEASLLGKSAAEQEALNRARHLGVEGNADYVAAIREGVDALHEQLYATDRQIELLDSVRGAATGLFDDLKEGGDIWDSIGDAVDRVAERLMDRAFQEALDGLFGQQGESGGGAWGNAIAGVISAIFGGGRASGGATRGGTLYEVAEGGRPELFSSNGRTYLLSGSDGHVSPASHAASAAPAAGAAMPRIEVNIHQGADENRVDQTPDGSGGMKLDIWLERQTRNTVHSMAQRGELSRYGMINRGVSRG